MFNLKILTLFPFACFCLLGRVSNVETARLEFCEHVVPYGVTCETLEVVTEDGFRLGIQRIGNGQPEKIAPVLVWHGAACSSDSMIIMGNESTPVQLAQAGYDVWMGNSRGNLYSRHHTTLDPDKDTEFWDFSFHDMAYYDLPATIDHILNVTRNVKLFTIAHSQGTTMSFALGSLRPEYNSKIRLFIGLAPATYMPRFDSRIVSYFLSKSVLDIANSKLEHFAANSTEYKLLQTACSRGVVGYKTCMALISVVGGPFDDGEMTREIFDNVLEYLFGGISQKSIKHFVQIFHTDRFAYYDYGALRNLIMYGSVEPPEYDMNKVTMPVAMLCGDSDHLATLDNAFRIYNQLRNVSMKVFDNPSYNHCSFLASTTMGSVLNPTIFDLLRKY